MEQLDDRPSIEKDVARHVRAIYGFEGTIFNTSCENCYKPIAVVVKKGEDISLKTYHCAACKERIAALKSEVL